MCNFEDCDFLGEVFSFELILYGKPKLTQWTKNVLTCALPKTRVSLGSIFAVSRVRSLIMSAGSFSRTAAGNRSLEFPTKTWTR